MATDESARLHLYDQARHAWGDDAASTLMTSLPWDPDRFATKDDLTGVETRLRGEIAGVRGEVAELRGELRGEMHAVAAANLRGMVTAMIATNATLVGLVFAAAKLG